MECDISRHERTALSAVPLVVGSLFILLQSESDGETLGDRLKLVQAKPGGAPGRQEEITERKPELGGRVVADHGPAYRGLEVPGRCMHRKALCLLRMKLHRCVLACISAPQTWSNRKG